MKTAQQIPRQGGPFEAWDRLLDEALQALRQQRISQAIELLRPIAGTDSRKATRWPHYRHALGALAFALYRNGEAREALVHQTRLLTLYPADREARSNFLHVLQVADTDVPDSREFRGLLRKVLAQTDIGLYAVPAARAFLKDAEVRRAVGHLLGSGDEAAVRALRQGRFRVLMQSPLLLLPMRETLIPLPEIEALFGKARRTLLLAHIGTTADGEPWIPGRIESEFMGALAHYFWLTEYAIPEDEEKSAWLAPLRSRIGEALESSSGRFESLQWDFAYLALYQSWLELPGSEALFGLPLAARKPFLRPLIQEWQHCLEERRLRAAVPGLTPIRDGLSQEVRRQYEENPFPRWKHHPAAHRRMAAGDWLAGLTPAVRLPERFSGPIDVLAAGCGTGLEPISLARQIETGRFLAVDLSRASLAYAIRMAKQWGLAEAIDFRQADILNLGELPERFDLITASGVLHHLEDPLAGWRILADRLRSGGIMLVSLYSEAARQPVVQARQLIAEQGWKPTPDRMRQLRKAILDGRRDDLRPLTLWRDFYNLGMFRDLVFHVQEHRFSLPLIQRHLAELNLRFLGMRGLPAPIQGLYRTMFPEDPHGTDLDHWACFEARYPTAFVSMYGLVLQKPWPEG